MKPSRTHTAILPAAALGGLTVAARSAAVLAVIAAEPTDYRSWRRHSLNFRGRPDFRAFHAEMRQPRPDVSRMAFFAFDIMVEGGVDIRSLSLSQRQKNLARACGKGREPIPHLFLVEAFPEGEPLLEWCARYQLEGIVSKRRAAGYASGTSRHWVKVKYEGWREANQHRHKLFQGPRKAEQSPREREPEKKRGVRHKVRRR